MGRKARKASKTPCIETFDPLHVECKTPATAVLLLRSPEEDIIIKTCEALFKFSEKGEENKVSLLRLGILEHLCQLITHNNKLVRRHAFVALGAIATNVEVRNALKNIDVLPSIIDKLSLEEDVVVQEFATLCLASMSVDFVCKVKIFECNALPVLIQLISSPDPDVQKNSLETIFNLVQDYPSRQTVHELGGIPPLLDLLKSDFPVIQHLASKTLENVTHDRDTVNTFKEKQGFEKIMDILSNKDFNDLHAEALQVVANCLFGSESLDLIYKMGGLTRLMEFVVTPNMPEIQSNAVKCIARAAQSSENGKLLHEQNVEKALVKLLSVVESSVKTAACKAVSAMSFHQASKDSFRDLSGIPAVVKLLNDESLELREAATEALANLTHVNQQNSFAVYEAGGHKILIQQLFENCPRTVANSAATLGNMAAQVDIRCSILSYRAMQALVEPLKSTDPQVVVNSTQCLVVLACEAKARAELLSAGGLQPLVSLLQSYNVEVLQNACMAIDVCASDEPTVVEMCKYGALELLQEINQSHTRRSSFSKQAMTSLLNSNVSTKYSLMDYLASTDIICDGFYDAGKARAGQRILTLEELSKQPVNQHQPIIVVNAAVEEKLNVADERPRKQSMIDKTNKRDRKPPRKKKEDDKQENETQPETPAEKRWKMMEDISLQLLVKQAKDSTLSLGDERERYAALARLVSETMGGAVDMEKYQEFSWVLHLSELKFQLQSNVVPIGLIRRGIYRHRALLFKYLVHCIGMSCTLVRGDYNRAWNEVLLFNGRSSQPCHYIVDLMHNPGSLLIPNTPAAEKYQTI